MSHSHLSDSDSLSLSSFSLFVHFFSISASRYGPFLQVRSLSLFLSRCFVGLARLWFFFAWDDSLLETVFIVLLVPVQSFPVITLCVCFYFGFSVEFPWWVKSRWWITCSDAFLNSKWKQPHTNSCLSHIFR